MPSCPLVAKGTQKECFGKAKDGDKGKSHYRRKHRQSIERAWWLQPEWSEHVVHARLTFFKPLLADLQQALCPQRSAFYAWLAQW